LIEHDLFGKPLRTFPDHALASFVGARTMIRTSVMGNLRRRRAIASLYRQTGACRLLPARPRLDFADEPDQVALAQLESYFWRAERRQPVW
jgi:hypothetical protein